MWYVNLILVRFLWELEINVFQGHLIIPLQMFPAE